MDKAFKGLLVKEFYMMRYFYFIVFILQIIFLVFIASDEPTNNGSISFMTSQLTIGIILLPATILFSLNTETNHMEQFLHNPQSIHKLLLAKFLTAFVITVLFFVIFNVVISFSVLLDSSFNITFNELINVLLWFSFFIISLSIYITAIVLLFWSFHQLLKKYLGWVLSVIALLFLFSMSSSLFSWFKGLSFYQHLTNWGKVTYQISDDIDIPSFSGMGIQHGIVQLFVGQYLFYVFLIICCYLLTALIIDRKVEV